MSDKQERYKSALAGKKIPVLTLDNKWHKLFTQAESTKEIANLTEQLNGLLKNLINRLRQPLLHFLIAENITTEHLGNLFH